MSRIRADSVSPVRSNSAKFASVAPAVSVECSTIGRSVMLPKIPSRVKCASGAYAMITLAA
jgi:hypothetical protein